MDKLTQEEFQGLYIKAIMEASEVTLVKFEEIERYNKSKKKRIKEYKSEIRRLQNALEFQRVKREYLENKRR